MSNLGASVESGGKTVKLSRGEGYVIIRFRKPRGYELWKIIY